MQLTIPQAIVSISGRTNLIIDDTGDLGTQEVLDRIRKGNVAPVSTPILRLPISDATYWLHTSAKSAGQAGRWIFELQIKAFPDGEAWVVRGDRLERVYFESLSTGFHDRPLKTPNVAFPVELGAGERVEILIRFRLLTDAAVDYTVQGEVAFLEGQSTTLAKYFISFGFLACFACLSIALAIALRLAAAVAYACYIIVVTLWAFHLDGLAFQYLWPDAPVWNQIAVRPLLGAMALTGLWFARSFLETAQRLPRFDRLLVLLMFAAAVQMAVGVAIGTSFDLLSGVVYYAGFLFTAAASLVYVAAGILSVRIQTPGSWYFLLGAVTVAITIIAAALAEALTPNATMEHTRDWGRTGLLIEGFFFLLGIGARITRIRRERNEAHVHAVAALEEKVALSEELRQAEAAFEEARSLAQDRQAMLAHATHDLRQPLVSMRLSLQDSRHLGEPDRRALERYLGYLEEIIDNHLARSIHNRVEKAAPSGVEQVEVQLLLDAVKEMFLAEAAEKGLSLRAVPTSLVVETDPIVAMRIVSNLVANAIKHTPAGGVLLGARRRGGSVLIAVHDTGPGLNTHELERLRKPGIRGKDSTGSGLGLAIIDTLAAKNGLEIHIRSRVGRGSCFGLLIPRSRTER